MPDKFHQHEVLHTLFIIQGNIEDYVLGNGLVHDERFASAMKLVEQAQALLSEAYQQVGSVEF